MRIHRGRIAQHKHDELLRTYLKQNLHELIQQKELVVDGKVKTQLSTLDLPTLRYGDDEAYLAQGTGGFGRGVYRLIDYGGALIDNGLLVAGLPTRFAPGDMLVSTAAAGQVDLTVNACGIIAYYPTRIPGHWRSRWLGDRDLFGEFVAAAKGLCLHVLGRMDCAGVHRDFAYSHPDWLMVDKEGRPYQYRDVELYYTCPNSPYYRQYIPDIFREVLNTYDIDGFFDNGWPSLGSCSLIRPCWCLTRRRPRSTRPRNDLSKRRLPRSCAVARRSSLRTGSRPCLPPIGSSCWMAAGSSSREHTRNSWHKEDSTHACTGCSLPSSQRHELGK